jgi:SAM-dependent methyltransferase
MINGLLEIVGCPCCQAPLYPNDEPATALVCRECGERYHVQRNMPVLLQRQDLDRFDQFSVEYRDARLRNGWQRMPCAMARALPYGQPPGFPTLYWQVRRESFCALMSLLAREGPSPADGPAADLGAGFGWLAYRLAQAGYRVVAVDANADDEFGLGAAQAYYALDLPPRSGSTLSAHPSQLSGEDNPTPEASFWLVRGDLEHAPLQARKLVLIILNASLHYAHDLQGTLQHCERALRPGGRLAIVDTPIARHPRPGTGQGDRHLGQQELHDALLRSGMIPRWIKIHRGPRWWLHQAKALLKRDARFSFPIVVADRA